MFNSAQMSSFTKGPKIRDRTPILIMCLQTIWISWLRLSTLEILVGKLTLANSRRLITCMIVTEMLNCSKSILMYRPSMVKVIKRKLSDKEQILGQFTPRPFNINQSMDQPQKSQTVSFQSLMIGETTLAMISQDPSVTNMLVVLAILLPSLRLLRLDLSLNTVKMYQNFPHKCFSIVTIWMRVVKVDGHISMHTWPRMDILFRTSVLHIKPQLLFHHAQSMLHANQSPKSKTLTILEVPMVRLQKREWWKRSWETVLLTLNFRLQVWCHPTVKVLCLPMVSNQSKRKLMLAVPKPRTSQIRLSTMLVEHGKILTIVLSSQVGVSMKPLKNIGSLETLTDQNGAKTVTFTLDAAKTISVSSPNKLHSTLNSFLEVFLSI